MTEFILEAKSRTEAGKEVRRLGQIPAVVYGNNFANQKISLKQPTFISLYEKAGTSNLIDLSIDDKKPLKVLIHEMQFHPTRGDILHVDLYKVDMKEKIHAEIPLKFIGESAAVVDQDGSLITAKDSVEVECLPANLLPEIEVDISVLDDFEKDIRVSDLKVPTGVEILDEAEEVIAHIEPPRSEEELEALEEKVVEDVSQVEVEAEKKEEGGAEVKGESIESKE